MTNQEYHSDTSRISKSGLDLINRSPLHYYSAYLAPDRPERKETDAMRKGTGFHMLTLEPEDFLHKCIVSPQFDRRSNAGKAAYAEFHAMAADKIILTEQQCIDTKGMISSLRKHPLLSEILRAGDAEKTFTWEDPETGAPCKCRPDWLSSSTGLVLDLKSTQDASRYAFGKSAYQHRYHVQSPFYLDGLEHSGHRMDGFVFAAVESVYPYAVQVYYVDDHVNDLGRYRYKQDLKVYAECLRSGNWPGLPVEISSLELPTYAFKSI